MTGIRATALAAGVAAMLATTASAAGADKPCLTRPEAEALATYVLPAVFEGLQERCAPALPISAYMRGAGKDLPARYRPASDQIWPSARGAVVKMMGLEKLGGTSDRVLKTLVEAGIVAAMTSMIEAKDCAMVDRFAEILDPLPGANMGRFVAMLLEIGAAKEKDGDLKMCPAA